MIVIVIIAKEDSHLFFSGGSGGLLGLNISLGEDERPDMIFYLA